MADNDHKPLVEVEIDGECYALDKIPPATSGVVKAEMNRLLESVDLKALVKDLSRVGGFIRVAYNAVGAAGHEHTETQIEIQKLGYDITNLCDKSVVTVGKFNTASTTILRNLKSSYGFLLGNLEEMALTTLSFAYKIAEEMEEAARELADQFEEQKEKVIATLENTQRAKKVQASKIEDEKKKRKELEEQIKLEENLIKEHQEQEREVEARRRELERKEDKAISEIGEAKFVNTMKALVNGLTKPIGMKLFETEDAKIKADKFKQSRLDALRTEKEIRDKRQEGMAKMSLFVTKLKQCSNDQEMAECAMEALHEAIGALKHLSLVMRRASLFWQQMKVHCHSLAESDMKKSIEKAMTYEKEMRLVVWTSETFKQMAVEFYAGWVALQKVCEEHIEQIKETQEDLYKYITENPTYEESKANLPDLAEKFMAELKLEQKAIEDKEFEAQKKIKDLNAPKRK